MVSGIDATRFDTNIGLYTGRGVRQDGFKDYGQYLLHTFNKHSLTIMPENLLKDDPDQLLGLARNVVRLNDLIISGAKLDKEEIHDSLMQAYDAVVEFGSVAYADYRWANSDPSPNAETLAKRRGNHKQDWFAWRDKKMEKIRGAFLTSPEVKLAEMKSVELTGDPITAFSESKALMEQLFEMYQS